VDGWEKGKYLQNREADALIRSLADREMLEKRAAKAGVTLPVVEVPPGAEVRAEAAVAGASLPTV